MGGLAITLVLGRAIFLRLAKNIPRVVDQGSKQKNIPD